MPVRASVRDIVISGDSVTVPKSTWRVFQGHNNHTTMTDTVLVVPEEEGGSTVFRWSAKKKLWNRWHRTCHRANDITPAYLMSVGKDGKGTISNIKELQPVVSPSDGAKCGGKKMMNLSGIFGRFGRAKKGDFAISLHGNVAVKRKDDSYACLDQNGALTNVDKFAAEVDAFFYVPTVPSNLVQNDVVVVGNGVGFVVEDVANNTIKVYDVNSESIKTIKPSTHVLMPNPFVTKVFSLLPNGNGNNPFGGGMNPLLMLMLLDGGKDSSDMLPMMLMANGGFGNGDVGGLNPMLLYMMLKDKSKDGGKSDLLPLLLLTGGLGKADGAGGNINPMLLFALMDRDGDSDNMLPLLMLSGGLDGGNVANAFGSLGGNHVHSGGCCGGAANAPASGDAPAAD